MEDNADHLPMIGLAGGGEMPGSADQPAGGSGYGYNITYDRLGLRWRNAWLG